MIINAQLIRNSRAERAWSQEDLAEATGLNLRTIQRIEKSGTASLQSRKSLALAFDLDIADLDHKEQQMSPCPECRSEEVYQYKELIESSTIGGEQVPKLASSLFSAAKILPVICASCGYLRYFADSKARAKLKTSKGWMRA
jgi:transcriptional regulator with XRE-family HTH domain